MNPTPRWSCRMVRQLAAMGGAGEGPLARRHVAHCDDCRAYFSAADALETQLRAEARHGFDPGSEALERRILRAVAESRIEPAPRRGRLALNVALGAAAACLVAVVTIQPVRELWSSRTTERPSRVVAPAKGPDAGEVALAPSSLWDILGQPMPGVLQEDPLKTEADSVYADARYAVRVLAANFVPSANTEGSSRNAAPRAHKPAG